MKNSKPDFSVISSWHEKNNHGVFPHIFIIEFKDDGWNKTIHTIYNRVGPGFKRYKKMLVEYLSDYGDQGKDWSIGKHRGEFNMGAGLILRFKDKDAAIAFMLENS